MYTLISKLLCKIKQNLPQNTNTQPTNDEQQKCSENKKKATNAKQLWLQWKKTNSHKITELQAIAIRLWYVVYVTIV